MQYLLTEEEYKELTEQKKNTRLQSLKEENKILTEMLNELTNPERVSIVEQPTEIGRELKFIIQFDGRKLSKQFQDKFKKIALKR